MLARRRNWAGYGGVALSLVVVLSACSGTSTDAPSTVKPSYSLGACSIISTVNIERIVGKQFDSRERSTMTETGAPGAARCDYASDGDPGLVLSIQVWIVTADRRTSADGVGTTCESPIPLAVPGAQGSVCAAGPGVVNFWAPYLGASWGNDPYYSVLIGPAAGTKIPRVEDVEGPMRDMLTEFMSNVSEDTFVTR